MTVNVLVHAKNSVYMYHNLFTTKHCGVCETCRLCDGVISDDELKDDLAGSTANVVLIKDNKIYCVSRCFCIICV